jgi:hypothetical protein
VPQKPKTAEDKKGIYIVKTYENRYEALQNSREVFVIKRPGETLSPINCF